MRFRNAQQKGIFYCYMSDKEKMKYGLTEQNLIESDGHLPYKIEDGAYLVQINGFPVEIALTTFKANDGYLGQVSANGVKFSVLKLRPLRRHDVLRGVMKRFRDVAKIDEMEEIENKIEHKTVVFAG